MGRFSCLVVVLASACAVDPSVGVPDGTDGTGLPAGADTIGVATRLVPSVCSVSEWPAKVTDTKMDISVAGRLDGAAITTMPITGGTATGFVVNDRMRIVHDQTLATGFDKVSVSYAANRFAQTAIAGDKLSLSLMTDDLSDSQLVTTVAGNVVAKPAIYATDGGLVMPVGGLDGLTLYRLADSFEPIDSRLVVASNPVVSLTAARSGAATLAAWSTKDQCYMMQLAGLESGPMTSKRMPCDNPRLALDSQTHNGIMVADSPEGVRLTITQGAVMYGAELIHENTYAPRALFDGKHFWVSWINDRGDIIVGVLDENHKITSMMVSGPKPFAQSYELAMVEGAPWVFALDADGYTGHRMCVEQQ